MLLGVFPVTARGTWSPVSLVVARLVRTFSCSVRSTDLECCGCYCLHLCAGPVVWPSGFSHFA
ncbi:unnamed protein product [Brassica oleracea]